MLSESAVRYSSRLLGDKLVSPAANGEIHLRQPSVHRTSKVNFGATRLDRLSLEIEQDQASN
jgi:hypothetical protein